MPRLFSSIKYTYKYDVTYQTNIRTVNYKSSKNSKRAGDGVGGGGGAGRSGGGAGQMSNRLQI